MNLPKTLAHCAWTATRTTADDSDRATAHTVSQKDERKRIAWEAGAVSDEATFRREIADLRLQTEGLTDATKPKAERHGATLTTLVDRWDEMRADQRQSLLKSLLDEIVIRDGAIESAKPKADWVHLEAVFAACPAWGLVGHGPARDTRHIAPVKGQLVPAA